MAVLSYYFMTLSRLHPLPPCPPSWFPSPFPSSQPLQQLPECSPTSAPAPPTGNHRGLFNSPVSQLTFLPALNPLVFPWPVTVAPQAVCLSSLLRPDSLSLSLSFSQPCLMSASGMCQVPLPPGLCVCRSFWRALCFRFALFILHTLPQTSVPR